MVLVMKSKLYIPNTPPIKQMTPQMFDSWKHISKQENKIICIENGLCIFPSGRFDIDYESSAKYDAKYEYEKLMVRICYVQNKMEFILSNQLKDLVRYPSMQAVLELPKEKQDKILWVFTNVIAKKLAEHNNTGNSSNSD